MAIVSKKCIRCRKPMRNDGTETEPKWVCNNKNCVRYVPKEPEPTTEQTNETNNE
ncbi:hypothetical protein [Selenomonas ruminantium]|uniref:Uncharacterized protein n=1 Tax=Selenomonas ruminantium TaxID=971 RepID=A0A1I0VHE5_SELRU|nr:hypothetical protein [Selenomonas ruminantium]SFA75804.1 hypothetical protein SAMN05216587_101621 [Selenomonas ruminantium]